MEKALFVGYRFYSFTDPAQNKTYKGYTLYLLQEIKDKDHKNVGYIPLTFYDRYNNRQKYPSLNEEEFVNFGIDLLVPLTEVEISIDRRNKIIDLKEAL